MKRNLYNTIVLIISITIMTACGGPRINKKPQQLIDYGPMITVNDPHLTVMLDQILFRNSKGSWAKDAKWDEYILTIQKDVTSNNEVVIDSVVITDIMGEKHDPKTTRKSLNKGTSQIKRKYKKAGYKIKLGAGSTRVTAVGLSMAVGSGVTAGAVTATGAIGNLTSVGVGAAVAVPALLIAGVTKIVYNTKVNNRIQERQTLLPKQLDTENTVIDVLFPAIPLPQKLVINYTNAGVSHQISIDLTLITSDLHIKNN